MSQTRKTFFSRVVSITGGAAVLLNTLMAAAGWAETDSHEGTQCILSPQDETLYVGDNEDVRDAAGVGVYQGMPIPSGDSVNLAQYYTAGGIVDPNETWLYSAGTQDIGIIFKGL